MKKTYLFLFLVLVTLLPGCSTDDDETVPEPEAELPSIFTMELNGEVYYDSIAPIVYKTEDTFLIKTIFDHLRFSFNTSGQFGYFYFDLDDFSPHTTDKFYSFREYSSNYFNFNLAEVDLERKRIKGSYSGYLHSDPANLNSEAKFVTGIFDVAYRDLVPSVVHLGNHAKINGADWTSTNKYVTHLTGLPPKTAQHDLGDGPYKMVITYNQYDTPVGTYNFTSSDYANKIELAKFDPVTLQYVYYTCTGTLVVNRHQEDILGGTYQFTAINPNDPTDVIQVTDGVFKLVYLLNG